MAENTSENTHVLYDDEVHGSVKIADDVIAVIAALAATDIKGVASMAGNITNDLIAMLGYKKLSKGVRIAVNDGEVRVALNINILYGYSIPDVCAKVKEKVTAQIQNMTGLTVTEVKINIADVDNSQNI